MICFNKIVNKNFHFKDVSIQSSFRSNLRREFVKRRVGIPYSYRAPDDDLHVIKSKPQNLQWWRSHLPIKQWLLEEELFNTTFRCAWKLLQMSHLSINYLITFTWMSKIINRYIHFKKDDNTTSSKELSNWIQVSKLMIRLHLNILNKSFTTRIF